MTSEIHLIDTHAHLDAPEFEGEVEAVIARAAEAGIDRIITIGATGRGVAASRAAVAIAERFPSVWATVGVHPHSAGEPFDLGELPELAKHPRVVAIGEMGLDFYRDFAPRAGQERWFRAQVELAIQVKKPIVIHSREAGEDCIKILQELRAERVGGVFHCFAENAEFAARLRQMNFLVSIPGSITFKKNDSFREIVRGIPLEQIMVETDSPYMAPEPHRGKRCESSFMLRTAMKVAEIKGVSLEELAKVTTQNAERLFRLPVTTR